MSSLQQSRYIPFNNSAQRTQLVSSQGGFSQSLSGSETDVSTSNENLSREERYVIRHTARQEPQGQENLSSNRSSLDVSSSSYNTLIIHSAGDEPWTGRLSGIRDHQDGAPSYHIYSGTDVAKNKTGSHSPSPSVNIGKESSNDRISFENCGRLFDPSVREITDIPDDYLSQSHVLKHLAKEVKVSPRGESSGRESSVPLLEDYGDEDRDNSSMSNHFKRLSLNHKDISRGNQEAFEYDLGTLTASPEYSKWIEPLHQSPVPHRFKPASYISRKSAKPCLSRSQPDLSRIGTLKIEVDDSVPKYIPARPRPKTSGREKQDKSCRKDVWPPAEMVEILIQENSSLKLELETCYQKVTKAQKLEQEISQIHRAHEEIVQSSERRERLERQARARLQSECRRIQAEYRHLQDVNKALRDQYDALSLQHLALGVQSDISNPGTDDMRRELNKREILVAQLITQNKELVATKERQEIELAAQRATLQEQRTHIDILDTALTNAQGNVVRLEDECRKKHAYVERVGQLQRALQTLQMVNDRREQSEKKLRLQLEKELHNERARARGHADEVDGSNGARSGSIRSGQLQEETEAELKRQLREKEEKIMSLEGEVAKWEQRYLEESALRQAAIDAASIPKDAKIAALEKTSQETEKLIAEARSEKIRHMDEAHAAQKKLADLESRIKDLESKLAEKDAMIKVLQKHTYDKDVSSSSSYPSMLVRSPHHTPHPSLHGNTDLLGTSVSREDLDPVSTTSVFSTVSSVLTSSCSTGISSYASSDTPSSKLSSYHSGFGPSTRSKYGSVTLNNKSFDDSNKSLDDQLKELDSQLDSQLLSKRGLCCFPGFANTGTSPRKGKIPKPLLASVNVGDHLFLMPSRVYEQGRPEEIMLLEKQGRSSQQQRMQETQCGVRSRSGSLPPPSPGPSSLPRPRPRAHKTSGKLGEYGRLGDADLGKPPVTSRDRDVRTCSGIPSPKKLGEYGRLSDGEDGRLSRKPSITGVKSGRDSTASGTGSAGSDDSNSRSKLRLFPGPRARRGSSLTRESKPVSTDSSGSAKSVASTGTTKYRIHF